MHVGLYFVISEKNLKEIYPFQCFSKKIIGLPSFNYSSVNFKMKQTKTVLTIIMKYYKYLNEQKVLSKLGLHKYNYKIWTSW